MFKAPSDVEGATQPAPTAAPPSQDAVAGATPASETDSEVHPLIVPEAPPVPGAPVTKVVKKVVRARVEDPGVPPPPPLARTRKASGPSGREFEPNDIAPPVAPPDAGTEANPPATKQGIGYKSLIEADSNRPPAEAASPAPAPVEETSEKPAKGNRFFRAVGKIFHPAPKKDTTQLTLQPKDQQD